MARKKVFDTLASGIYRHHRKILLAAVILLFISGFFASRIVMQVHLAGMLPEEKPQVEEFNRIIADFYAASRIFVVIEGENEGELTRAAAELAPILAEVDNVRRVDYRIDTDFIKRHALLLRDEDELRASFVLFSRLELLPFLRTANLMLEKGVIENEERFRTLEEEFMVIRALDGLTTFLVIDAKPEQVRENVRQLLLGEEHFLSPDNQMLIMQVHPAVSFADYLAAMDLARAVRAAVDEFGEGFPDLNIGITGLMPTQLEDEEALREGMALSALVALFLILALLIIAFRMRSAPFIAMTPIILGVTYTAGFIGAVIGHLNMFTAFFAVLLMGLGIDFAIHLTNAFLQARAEGMDVPDSLKTMYAKVGKGVIVGAITTAVVFFTFGLTGLDVLAEMGFVNGTGILITLASVLVVLPALFCFQDKLKSKRLKSIFGAVPTKTSEFGFLEAGGRVLLKYKWAFASFFALITVVLLFSAMHIEFQYDILAMYPEDMPAVVTQERVIDEFGISPDPSMLIVDSVTESREMARKMREEPLVGRVESIADFIPPADEQKEIRLPLIRAFRAHLLALQAQGFDHNVDVETVAELEAELTRLEDNIAKIEELAYAGGHRRVAEKSNAIIEQGIITRTKGLLSVPAVSSFQENYIPALHNLLLEMTAVDEIITLDTLPAEIRDQFVCRDGDSFLLTIFPQGDIWDEQIFRAFNEQVTAVAPRTSGTPIFFLLLLDLILERVVWATAAAAIVVFAIVAITFKSSRTALVGMVPIILGATWMVGLMQVLGMKFDFTNLMAVPLILGIGIDNAIHIIHRYGLERNIPLVLRTTGKAILLTALTTMIAFGSLGFSPHPGLAGMGYVLVIGVAACLITAVFVLPLILAGKEERLARQRSIWR
ncbi:MMPL family transporter [Dehalococcoidia bacterium]|nr:MMPL family transporter [Dehalococcoidia bacterium]